MKFVTRESEVEQRPRSRRSMKASTMSNRIGHLSEKQVDERWQAPAGENRHHQETLPVDPRDWARCDVSHWLLTMAEKHKIPDMHLERFLMNGKALCLMSLEMYLTRVPLGGKMLYRDFQLRLGRAMWLKNECS